MLAAHPSEVAKNHQCGRPSQKHRADWVWSRFARTRYWLGVGLGMRVLDLSLVAHCAGILPTQNRLDSYVQSDCEADTDRER